MARILLVDDEEMDRTIGKAILEGAGHELFYAPNGEVALRTYMSHDIDLVITDLVMPNLNGILLIQELRKLDRNALVLALTGVSPEQLDRAKEAGAASIMRKPYTPQALLQAVTNLLETRIVGPDDFWY